MLAVTITTWTELLAIATLVLAAATVLLVGGVLVAWFSSREERNASQMQAAVAIFAEYRSREMRAARARIHEFPPCDPSLGLEQLTGEDREAAELVSHFLDSVGVLISRHYLASDAIDAFLGGSALGMWRDLEPYIHAERTVNRRPTYQENFEGLASRLEAIELATGSTELTDGL